MSYDMLFSDPLADITEDLDSWSTDSACHSWVDAPQPYQLDAELDKTEILEKLVSALVPQPGEVLYNLRNKEGKVIAKTLVDEDSISRILRLPIRRVFRRSERFDKPKWRLHWVDSVKCYVVREAWKSEKSSTSRVYLHRKVVYGGLEGPSGLVVDHINGNPLDNTRRNLRRCDHSLNLRNQFRIPRRNAKTNMYGVQVRKGNTDTPYKVSVLSTYGGVYSSLGEAARRADELAVQLMGRYAPLNFPERWVLDPNDVPF